MKYIVKRTSEWDDKKPCEEAFLHPVAIFHERTCTEEYFDSHFAAREGKWRSKGKNHSIPKKGHILRQEDDKDMWVIEINTLEELNDFVRKYGECIIKDSDYSTQIPEIEIYDDYRE